MWEFLCFNPDVNDYVFSRLHCSVLEIWVKLISYGGELVLWEDLRSSNVWSTLWHKTASQDKHNTHLHADFWFTPNVLILETCGLRKTGTPAVRTIAFAHLDS